MRNVFVLMLLAAVAFAAKEPANVNLPVSRDCGVSRDGRGMRPVPPPVNPVKGIAGPVSEQIAAPIDWGLVVTVDTGYFPDYACDYNPADGTMWVARSTYDSIVKLYRSTDHGQSWQYVYWMGTDPSDVFQRIGLVVG